MRESAENTRKHEKTREKTSKKHTFLVFPRLFSSFLAVRGIQLRFQIEFDQKRVKRVSDQMSM